MARVLKFKRKRRPYPIIRYTNDACIINRLPQSGIPIIIDCHNQVVWELVSWFRYLKVTETRPTSSLSTYADHMRMFWEHLSNEGRDWKDVDDDFLRDFRNLQRSGVRISHKQKGEELFEGTINGRLMTILAFYWWCHKNGKVREDMIGPSRWEEEGHFRPQIVLDVKGYDPRSDSPYKDLKYSSPLLYKNIRAPKRTIPTEDQTSKMQAKLSSFRDQIMSQWTEQTGLRAFEICKIKVEDVPSFDDIDALEDADNHHKFLLKGKGRKERFIYVQSDLLTSTREYIEGERAQLVERKKKKGGAYHEPEEVFLSKTTGQPLDSETFSKYVTKAFRKTGVDARNHDLRAKFITKFIQQKIDNIIKEGSGWEAIDVDTILLEAAERLGHASIEYLRPYVVLERKRLLAKTPASKADSLDTEITAKKRRLQALTRQVREIELLREAAGKLTEGDRGGFIREVEELLRNMKAGEA